MGTVVVLNTTRNVLITEAVQTSTVIGTPGPQGIQGIPGPSGSAVALQVVAGATISANTAVAVIGGVLVPASSSNSAHVGNVVGISVNGGPSGTLIDVQQNGDMILSSWSWALGAPVYVGLTGPLTQTAPTAGFLQIVGTPVTADSVSIALQAPVILV